MPGAVEANVCPYFVLLPDFALFKKFASFPPDFTPFLSDFALYARILMILKCGRPLHPTNKYARATLHAQICTAAAACVKCSLSLSPLTQQFSS